MHSGRWLMVRRCVTPYVSRLSKWKGIARSATYLSVSQMDEEEMRAMFFFESQPIARKLMKKVVRISPR